MSWLCLTYRYARPRSVLFTARADDLLCPVFLQGMDYTFFRLGTGVLRAHKFSLSTNETRFGFLLSLYGVGRVAISTNETLSFHPTDPLPAQIHSLIVNRRNELKQSLVWGA